MSRKEHDNCHDIAQHLHSTCKSTQQLMRFGRAPALFLSQPTRQWRADLQQRTWEQTRPERDELLDRLALARSFPGNQDPLASFAPEAARGAIRAEVSVRVTELFGESAKSDWRRPIVRRRPPSSRLHKPSILWHCKCR